MASAESTDVHSVDPGSAGAPFGEDGGWEWPEDNDMVEDESKPYENKYRVRRLLQEIRDGDGVDLDVRAEADQRLGHLSFAVEEPHVAEEQLSSAIEHFLPGWLERVYEVAGPELDTPQEPGEPLPPPTAKGISLPDMPDGAEARLGKPRNVLVLTRALGSMSVLCSSRTQLRRALIVLMLAERIGGREAESDIVTSELGVAHTHTLFFLAQAYGNLGEVASSARYCQMTLKRQLASAADVEPTPTTALEWATNCLGLAAYYLGSGSLATCARCLQAAGAIVEAHGVTGEERQRFEADANVRWGHLFAAPLREAFLRRERLNAGHGGGDGDGDDEDRAGASRRAATELAVDFETLRLGELPAPELLDPAAVQGFPEARAVFIKGNSALERAAEYYVLDGFVTDHVSIRRDQSQLYRYLGLFEQDLKRKLAMQQRRVDMLRPFLWQLSHSAYEGFQKQVSFEVGEVMLEMFDIKLQRMEAKMAGGERVKKGELVKLNALAAMGAAAFSHFTNLYGATDAPETSKFFVRGPDVPSILHAAERTCNAPDESRLPADEVGPFLRAHMHIARLLFKFCGDASCTQVQALVAALRQYQWMVAQAEGILSRKEVPREEFSEEMDICRQMEDLLPSRIDKMRMESQS